MLSLKEIRLIIPVYILLAFVTSCQNNNHQKVEETKSNSTPKQDSLTDKTKIFQDFQKKIAVQADTILIQSSRDTLIIGKKGTGIFLEKEALTFPDGSQVKGKIQIVLKECLDVSDMIREHLSTLSNGELLQTNGMINLTAFSDGKELKLKKGKKVIIHFPKKDSHDTRKMCLFYTNADSTKNMNWKLDSTTLLKPTAYVGSYSFDEGYHSSDSTNIIHAYYDHIEYHLKGNKQKLNWYKFFTETFNLKKLKDIKSLIGKSCDVDFVISKEGKIKNVTITLEKYDANGIQKLNIKPDPYITEYFYSLPEFEPILSPKGVPKDFHFFSFTIHFDSLPPDYYSNDSYNKLFHKKYSPFMKKNIQSISSAELHYFIFSSSKLGWINCDYFWKNNNEKIDYIVKTGTAIKSDILLVFRNVRSLMQGQPTDDGDNFVYHNIPINEPIKIVSIKFEGVKPMLSVVETQVSKTPFSQFDYKEFTIADLEKQIN